MGMLYSAIATGIHAGMRKRLEEDPELDIETFDIERRRMELEQRRIIDQILSRNNPNYQDLSEFEKQKFRDDYSVQRNKRFERNWRIAKDVIVLGAIVGSILISSYFAYRSSVKSSYESSPYSTKITNH